MTDDAERRRAWDGYVAGQRLDKLKVVGGGSITPEVAASVIAEMADALLAERDKRFSPQPTNDSRPLGPTGRATAQGFCTPRAAGGEEAAHPPHLATHPQCAECDRRERLRIAALAEDYAKWCTDRGLHEAAKYIRDFSVCNLQLETRHLRAEARKHAPLAAPTPSAEPARRKG